MPMLPPKITGKPASTTAVDRPTSSTSSTSPTSAKAAEGVEDAAALLAKAYDKLEGAERKEARDALAQDPQFAKLVRALGTYENAANALAVAMTYLKKVPDGTAIQPADVATKIVGHIGATTAISRTYSNLMGAVSDERMQGILDKAGIAQTHVVTGPGHGAAANFALLFFEGVLAKIYPERYPLNATGLQNLIADFCRPGSPLPSHVFPGVPSVSEGGELGYSLGIAAGAGIANADALILAQIGDKEAELGPLQAAIENHNAVFDFRKGLVLPIVHANGLGISGTSIISARSNDELRGYLRGLGYQPRIIDAEDTDAMRKADAASAKLDKLLQATPVDHKQVDELRKEIRSLRDESALQTNSELQRAIQRSIVNLASKKAAAVDLESLTNELTQAKADVKPGDDVGAKRIEQLEAKRADAMEKFRLCRTPFIVYREAKGGGHAPAFVDGKPMKGAPPSHQIILQPKDLLSDTPGAREHLQRWLEDLTRDVGVKGLVPTEGTPLGDASRLVLPREKMRVGEAPLALGKAALSAGKDPKKLDFVDPKAFVPNDVTSDKRGVDARGSNDLIDKWLFLYTDENRGDVFFFGADTAESNKLKGTVTGLGRRLNLPKGEHHPSSTSPQGDAIDILSEQYLMSMAQGVVNSGKQAIITNYEAFHQVSASLLRQFIKFRKQSVEANEKAKSLGNPADFRPPVPNMVLHLSSILGEQDHNGFSHQNPGLVDDLAADPREHVQVFFPAEATSALLMMDRAVRGTDQVVAVVADKQPRKQFLTLDEAKTLSEKGALPLEFASDLNGAQKPDVVLAATGGYQTDEALAASQIIKAFNEQLKGEGKRTVNFSTVAVAEPFKMRPHQDEDNFAMQALRARGRGAPPKTDKTIFDDTTFSKLFPVGAPVVWTFGGFERTAKGLVDGRDRVFSVHGYRNEGSTTTRFDMMARNGCDRFTLAADVVERAFRNGAIDEDTKNRVQQFCADQLIAHDGRIKRGDGDDPQWIKDGAWPKPGTTLAPPKDG
jgi:xylulose-5-phosphate/fructose-6-phosphate phosphoketolase